MSSLLKIDQSGLDPGTAGLSRTDGLADGELVTLTNTGAGTTTAFELLWTPPGDTTAIPSLAATGDPKVWTFSPRAKRYGTFLVALIIDGVERERRTLTIRTPGGLVIPALNERGNRLATIGEPGDLQLVDNNADDSPDPNLAALPFAGWWRALHEIAMATDALIAPVRITLAHGNAGGAVTHTGYRTLGEALAVNFPSSFPSVAVYDIEPTVIGAPDVGPYTLDSVVSIVLRAARGGGGSGIGVELPEMTLQSDVAVEGCTLANPVTGGSLVLRQCSITASVETASVEAYDCTVTDDGPVTVDSEALLDRCAIGAAPITALADEATVTLINCTFAPSPSIVFSGVGPGVVRMDARSKFLWDAAAGGVTNGAITVEAPP